MWLPSAIVALRLSTHSYIHHTLGKFSEKMAGIWSQGVTELFDEMIYRIFGDIPYCMNQRDYIVIGGRNMAGHIKTIIAVLQRAEDFGIIFNREKCEF